MSLARWGSIFGTSLAWFVVTYVVAAFIRNAHTFARLGAQHMRIDLFKPPALYPFGLVAVLPTLDLIGTQALHPLLSLDGGLNALAMLPGLTITLAALTCLFFSDDLAIARTNSDGEARSDTRRAAADRYNSPTEFQPGVVTATVSSPRMLGRTFRVALPSIDPCTLVTLSTHPAVDVGWCCANRKSRRWVSRMTRLGVVAPCFVSDQG